MRIFLNGRIYTLDSAQPLVEAVACEQGRVVAIGDSPTVGALAATPSEVIDLEGRTAVPGLIDAHIHFLGLGLALSRIDLRGERSLADCLARIAERLRADADGGWIVGRGWNQNDWAEHRWPHRRDLDAVTGERPAALSSNDGHLLWVNTAALAAANITRETPDPVGGEIARDASGEPTGVLKENATEIIHAAVPPPSEAEVDAALRRAMDHALRLGVTGIGNFEGPEALRAFGRLRERGELRLRVTQHLPHAGIDEAIATGLFSGLGDDWLQIGALKLFADGTLGSQTASMIEPFDGSATNRGIATLTREAMYEAARRAAGAGIATAIHAIGDRANRDALGALAAVPRVAAMPHRIEHAQLLHPDDIDTFARHGIVASMQPIHAIGDRDTADCYWGRRASLGYAWKSLRASGATLAFGSDAPVESCDPLLGLYAATERHGIGDGREPWYPAQALTIHDALWAYTVGAALATGEERSKGSLTPGRLADMVVLSEDMTGGADALAAARVVMTIVAGEVVASRS